MSLSIKVCGMTRPDNIRALASLAPDWVGLIFHPSSPRNALSLTPEQIKELREGAIGDTLRFTGVFVDRPVEEILRRVKDFRLSAVQLHGGETPEECASLRGHGFEVWKAVGIETADDFKAMEAYVGKVDRFVLDRKSARHGGTGKKFDWDLLSLYDLPVGFMLGGGIGPEDAEQIAAISHPRLMGLDLNSRFESTPGVKDTVLLNKFITSLMTVLNDGTTSAQHITEQ